MENRISIKDNNAGYWLHIDMYTEPGRCGDHYGIRSGGTGEVIAGDGVYRVGYWGNGKALEMMDAFYQMFMEEFGIEEEMITSETISSTISDEMTRDTVIAVLVASVGMLIYIR